MKVNKGILQILLLAIIGTVSGCASDKAHQHPPPHRPIAHLEVDMIATNTAPACPDPQAHVHQHPPAPAPAPVEEPCCKRLPTITVPPAHIHQHAQPSPQTTVRARVKATVYCNDCDKHHTKIVREHECDDCERVKVKHHHDCDECEPRHRHIRSQVPQQQPLYERQQYYSSEVVAPGLGIPTMPVLVQQPQWQPQVPIYPSYPGYRTLPVANYPQY